MGIASIRVYRDKPIHSNLTRSNTYPFMNIFRSDQFPLVIMGVAAVVAIVVFWSVMDMILLGASLAIILMPLHDRLSRHTRPLVSATGITILVFGILAVVAACTVLILSANTPTLIDMFNAINVWLNNPTTDPMTYGVPFSKESLAGILSYGTALFVNYQKTIIAQLPLIAFKLFVFFFSTFILLFRGHELKRKLLNHAPNGIARAIHRYSEVTVDTLYAIYVVQVLIAVLTFFIALPVFYLLGYGHILFYSFLAAFCELIPILGSSVAFILIGAYALSLGDMKGVIILFVLGYLVVSCLPEIYIRPVLVGRRVKINPIIMFIGIIGGLLTMGLAGFVLGPVIIVLLITSYRMYIKEKKMKPNLYPEKSE
jgi:predicted PurR-regulated permease PerM